MELGSNPWELNLMGAVGLQRGVGVKMEQPIHKSLRERWFVLRRGSTPPAPCPYHTHLSPHPIFLGSS